MFKNQDLINKKYKSVNKVSIDEVKKILQIGLTE